MVSEIPEKHDSSLFAVPDTVISGELNYVDEIAPFTRDDWNYMVNRMKTSRVVVSGELQTTGHASLLAKQLLEQYERQKAPDAIYAEYTDSDGVKYAGTLCRVAPKEQGE